VSASERVRDLVPRQARRDLERRLVRATGAIEVRHGTA
jgi:hypothetical protein